MEENDFTKEDIEAIINGDVEDVVAKPMTLEEALAVFDTTE